jgi:hypothetical protein
MNWERLAAFILVPMLLWAALAGVIVLIVWLT